MSADKDFRNEASDFIIDDPEWGVDSSHIDNLSWTPEWMEPFLQAGIPTEQIYPHERHLNHDACLSELMAKKLDATLVSDDDDWV